MRSYEASSSETTTCENFLYCYQDLKFRSEGMAEGAAKAAGSDPVGVGTQQVAEIVST
jgi:hypothetical protein